MAWLISALGALLALGGGYALWSGSGYIRLDWGQAETVAGTVALSGGIVTIAVAALLFALRDLARGPAAAAPNRLAGKLATMGLPKADPAAAEEAPTLAATPPFAEVPPLRATLPPSPEPASIPEAPLPAPDPAAGDAPTVVGRYEANGASYVLFSDGTIEVETEHGTHRFESMAALRQHIEHRDAG